MNKTNDLIKYITDLYNQKLLIAVFYDRVCDLVIMQYNEKFEIVEESVKLYSFQDFDRYKFENLIADKMFSLFLHDRYLYYNFTRAGYNDSCVIAFRNLKNIPKGFIDLNFDVHCNKIIVGFLNYKKYIDSIPANFITPEILKTFPVETINIIINSKEKYKEDLLNEFEWQYRFLNEYLESLTDEERLYLKL